MNFFDADVIQDKDVICCLDTGGFRLPVPEAKQENLMPYIGKKVVLGIRPEDIHAKDYVPTGIIPSPVKADVDVIENMGNEVYLHLTSNGKPFLARVDPRTRARAGQSIEVVFNMANMHAFEADSGKTIAN